MVKQCLLHPQWNKYNKHYYNKGQKSPIILYVLQHNAKHFLSSSINKQYSKEKGIQNFKKRSV